ncbi:hypothetical protein AAC387_Pa02g2228 [Persea americana]
MSSSSVTKTVSSFDSRRVNVLVTNSEQPPPDDNMALRIQQLEQGQQRLEVLMENLLLTLQRPPNNDEVPPQDEANGGEDESRALTKKDVDNILAKAKEEDTLKEHGIRPPYPLWMELVLFSPKFKQPLLQTYTGKGSARQHVIHFKILTGTIADQDALKIRLFASTLKGMTFDWYSTLPEDSIQNWTMLETCFLTHFKGEDHPVTMAQLCSLKQGENESTYDFIHKWKAMAYKCSDVLPQASLVDICRNNMRTRIRSMIIGNKSKNLGELLEASMEAETVIKDLNSQKSSKKEPTAIPTSKPYKKKVLNVQTKSAPQPPKKAENKAARKRFKLSDAFKERVEKKYLFDEDVEETFGALLANGKLTLPDPKRPGDVGKTNDPRYCPYHQMVSHPLNQCFVVREKINEMWKNRVITFDKNYGSASVNMVTYGQTSKSPKEKITTSFKEIVKTKPTAQQRRQAKRQLRNLKQQEKAQTKQEVPEKAETSSTASQGATEESLPKGSRVARKFTLGDFMLPRFRDETMQGASYSCNSVVGFSMNGYESSDTASDTDEWEESLDTGEYLSNEEWIPESHLMPVIWYNPFQPQGSWSDDDEDQEAAQNAVDTAQTNALVDPNQVEPQGADEEEDLAPMPDLEEYARILQRLAIEQEQDDIN